MRRYLAFGFLCLALLWSLGSSFSEPSDRSSTAKTSLSEAAAKWEHAVEAKRPQDIATFFSQDAIAMYPHPLPTYGREANLKIWQIVFEDAANEHPVTVDKVEVSKSGDIGYTYGRYWSRKPKRDYYSGGRYMAAWKLIDDEWQIMILSANVHEDIKTDRLSK